MDKITILLYIVAGLGLLLSFLSAYVITANAIDYTPERYIAYFNFYLNENNRNVHLWFVYDGEDIPICQKKVNVILYGCTRYFKDPYHADYVYVVLTEKLDKYGNTQLAHELKHVICSCAWHD